MATTTPQQVFTDTQLYLWRIRYESQEEWEPKVFVMASDAALNTMQEALLAMKTDYAIHGKSSRKFLCNPPEDVDVVRFAQEHQAELEWLLWLVIRLEPDVPENTQYELKNKAVTLRVNEPTLDQFLDVLRFQQEPDLQPPQNMRMLGGLFFASDWLGID